MTFTISSEEPEDNSTFVEVSTCRGTEESLATLYPNLTSKRVQIGNYLNYVKLEPYDGGCVYTRVNLIELGGRLPIMNKGKSATEQML